MLDALKMFKQSPSVELYDSAAGDAVKEIGASAIDKRAALAATQEMRKVALSIVLQLADDVTENALDADELPSERLDALMSGALGLDDGEADDVLVQLLSAHIADALGSLKVPDAVISDMFGEDVDAADSAIDAMAETVIANLPAEGAELDDFVKAFVYGFSESDMSDADDSDDVEEYDAMFGSRKKLSAGQKTTKKVNGHSLLYKAVKVIRNGIAKVINRRVGGTFVPSAKQKAAMHKLHAKPRTASMIAKMQRSSAKGEKMGLHPSVIKKMEADHAVKLASRGTYHPSNFVPQSNAPKHVKEALWKAGEAAKAKFGK